MKIQGAKTVTNVLRATFKQSYPVATKNDYFVGEQKADLVVATEKVNLMIDDVLYNGIHVYLFFKDK